jgi:hypothetical protein
MAAFPAGQRRDKPAGDADNSLKIPARASDYFHCR